MTLNSPQPGEPGYLIDRLQKAHVRLLKAWIDTPTETHLPGGKELSSKISAAIVYCEQLITTAQADASDTVTR